MRPGQNKRLRGRSGRKGPNPLTRSYESNGPDVKIRGTAQHIAEKYLQLARDAQSSGDTIMAESLLQHAEHYFRLIAAAQAQQVNGFGRPQMEAEVEIDEDDDFAPLPDRFAPLAERLPQPAFQPQPQPFAPQPQQHFAQPNFVQAAPQPFEERPMPEMRQPDMRGERPERGERGERPERGERMERQPRQERPDRSQYGRDRNFEGGERQPRNFDRNRENRRFQPRSFEQTDEPAPGLPSFITAPTPARAVAAEGAAPPEAVDAERPAREHEGVNYHLSSRRRRRTRPTMDEGREQEAPEAGELPLE